VSGPCCYDGAAGWYDLLAQAYSLGRIRACKRAQLEGLAPGDRVLFAGAGTGGEAVEAARRGVRVTVLDRSPAMLARAARRFQTAGLAGAFLAGDVLDHAPPEPYDAVVAHFFLNVFPERLMPAVLRHLAGRVRPGGRLLIADFAPADGPLPARVLRRLYFLAAALGFRMLAGNPLHPLYDYVPLLPGAGLRLERTRRHGLPGGLELFRSLDAVRI